jgi:hypothetical protein
MSPLKKGLGYDGVHVQEDVVTRIQAEYCSPLHIIICGLENSPRSSSQMMWYYGVHSKPSLVSVYNLNKI